MPACRICQHTFKSLRFQTEHIAICTRCVNTLNESPEPAKNAEARFAEKLARGMQRKAECDLTSDDEWKRRRAQQTLADLDAAVAAKLHDWITKLLKVPDNSTRDFKIMRAHRRGLLRMEGVSNYENRSCGGRNWKEVAWEIRRRDNRMCMVCGATNTTLDVHHIIYLSNHGTNQQSNLITLCRTCHEAEHDRIFDFPESQDPESETPIQRPHYSPVMQGSLIAGVESCLSLGDGFLEDIVGAAGGEAISERANVSVRQGAQGVQQVGEWALSPTQESAVSHANASSCPIVPGERSSPLVAPPPRREANNRLPERSVTRAPHPPRGQGRVRTASNAKHRKWGVIIGGIIFCLAMSILIISLLQR